MNIADIALIPPSPSGIAADRSAEAVQAVGVEFDAMLFGLLLRAGDAQALLAGSDAAEASLWNDLMIRSLAQELARHEEPGFAKSLLAQVILPGGENNDR